MNLGKKILTLVGALMVASTVQAGLIVSSIDMLVAKTDYAVTPGSTIFDAAFNLYSAMDSDPICSLSLTTLDNVGGKQLCGGPRRDTGTAFLISGSNTGSTELQLGLDWGRGGFSFLQFDSTMPVVEQYTTDIWWSRNWNHGDVLKFNFNTDGVFNLLLIGFEGCCNGENSARWRSLDGQWQTLQAVPSPSAFSLMLLGIVLLGLGRHSKARHSR